MRGLEYWSIESWQGNSDVLPVAAFHNLDLSCNQGQFPQGMKAVVRVLHPDGRIAPIVVESPRSEIVEVGGGK